MEDKTLVKMIDLIENIDDLHAKAWDEYVQQNKPKKPTELINEFESSIGSKHKIAKELVRQAMYVLILK